MDITQITGSGINRATPGQRSTSRACRGERTFAGLNSQAVPREISRCNHHLEQFTGDMVSGTNAAGPHVDLARVRFGICDELGNRLDRYRGIHLHEKRLAMNARDRGDVAEQIEIELLVKCSVDGVHRSGHKERIPVRGRVYDRLGGDIASRARPILDDKLLTETLRQPLSY